jgi:adenosyl cobinamide kinase/adenosyl cobinamide phosphate guanylyltransferase
MIFVTGPLFAGKREYIRKALGLREEELAARAVWDVQELDPDTDLEALADQLAAREIVIATEIGGGVVPMDADARAQREAAGRLSCLLAERADTVVRVCCGLPQLLKGEWPCASG